MMMRDTAGMFRFTEAAIAEMRESYSIQFVRPLTAIARTAREVDRLVAA
jgi:hypothetical protein